MTVAAIIVLLVLLAIALAVRGDYPSASQPFDEEEGNQDPYDKGNWGQ